MVPFLSDTTTCLFVTNAKRSFGPSCINMKKAVLFFAIGGALPMLDNGSIVTKKMICIHFFATDRVAIDIDFAFICKTY